MKIPALELQEFLTQYANLTFPGQQVLRIDHFCHRDDQKWQTVFITEQNSLQLLMNDEGLVLGRYEQIKPLFAAEPVVASRDVEDLLEQLSGLRSRFSREKLETARNALEALSAPSFPFAPVYQVEQAGSVGVVDPLGQIVVPVEYAEITPFALSCPGDAGLFLCRRRGHRLNALDVFDINGNCIFRDISNLYPKEESRRTPANGTGSVEIIKSLWVIHQAIDHPFPENPDFQLVQEEAHSYSVKALRHPESGSLSLAAMEDTSSWRYYTAQETPPQDLLSALAPTVAAALGCSAQEVLARLTDYRAFCLERTPLSIRLAHVSNDTPLDKLGFGIRAHHCLVRRGLQTAADVMALSEEELSRLRRGTDEIIQEIRDFQSAFGKITGSKS